MEKTVIEVKETVRVWGYETQTFHSDYTVEQIKQMILEDEDTYGYSIEFGATIDEVSDSEVVQWLNDNDVAVEYDFEAEEVLDRDLDSLTSRAPFEGEVEEAAAKAAEKAKEFQ